MGESLLSVKNLTTKFSFTTGIYPVVDRVSFDLFRGKTLALVGESGCGKSMTALSLLRILPMPPALDSEGEVLYLGRNLLTVSEKEMRKIRGVQIAMIFQDPMSALNPVFTIGDQLLEVVDLHLDLSEQEAKHLVLQTLDDVGIPDPKVRIKAYPHELSGGMKQRVMIAMALLCEPDILIADEPTTALDVTIQAQVLKLMKKLQKKRGMAILLITHDLGVVAQMADDVVVMYATKAIESGTVHNIFKHRAHPYTQGLFESLPSLATHDQKLKVMQGSVPSIKYIPGGCPFHPRCPHVMKMCMQGEVPNFNLEQKGHSTKCWLYRGERF